MKYADPFFFKIKCPRKLVPIRYNHQYDTSLIDPDTPVMISYWSSQPGHACPAINYFKVTFFLTFIIWISHVLIWLKLLCVLYLEKVKNSSPQKLLADSRPTVIYCLLRTFSDCWQHVGNVSAKCWLRIPVEYQKSLCSQGITLHIDTKWNFFTWVRHFV